MIPGPGQYQVAGENEDTQNVPKSSSMFVSKSKRSTDIQHPKERRPGVGQYDIDNMTIAKKAEAYIDYEAANNKLKQNRLKYQRPGFSSNAKRFSLREVSDCEACLGPGYYDSETVEYHKKGQKVKELPRPFDPLIKPKLVDNIGTAVRFDYDNQCKDTPGPGAYNQEEQTTWTKKTFNKIF